MTLLYQTGYLTINGYRQIGGFRRYDLSFPNLEVENSFLTQLAPVYAGLSADHSINYQFAAAEALIAGDAEKFVKVLRNFFANIPYSLTDRQNEQMWQTIVYVLLKAIGFGVSAEVLTNEGRIDMTCETPAGIWLIEFKLDSPAEEALAQIDEKNYAEKYDFAGKTVKKIGISFSSEKRTIVDWTARRSPPANECESTYFIAGAIVCRPKGRSFHTEESEVITIESEVITMRSPPICATDYTTAAGIWYNRPIPAHSGPFRLKE